MQEICIRPLDGGRLAVVDLAKLGSARGIMALSLAGEPCRFANLSARSGMAEISDLSGRSHSVRHFLRIDELSIGFTLTPMAARRVIIGHVSSDDKLF